MYTFLSQIEQKIKFKMPQQANQGKILIVIQEDYVNNFNSL